jgi:hypothetical protein
MSERPAAWKTNRPMNANHLSNALQEIEKMIEEFVSGGDKP